MKDKVGSGGVLEYLVHKDESTLLELYNDATRGKYVCRAILQQLSSDTQQVVLRLCCCGGTFPTPGVMVWIRNNPQEYNHILSELRRWHIAEDQEEKALTLNSSFHKGLQTSLKELDSSPWTPLTQQQLQTAVDTVASNETSPEAIRKKRLQLEKMLPSLDALDQYTQRQWNTVLHFLVGTSQQEEPPPHVVHFLLQTGLMQPDPDSSTGTDDTLVITRKGYDFMLQPQQDQVWHFVQEYLKTSLEGHKKAKELKKEALLFLISLSFGRVGDAYDAKCLNKSARTLMMDLSLFGLLYVAKLDKNHVFFYPTRVAVQLLKTLDAKSSSALNNRPSNKAMEASLTAPIPDPNNLAIIVQTNFQVCAYTTSELHVSMLGLFCNVDTIRRLPNMVFMSLTRDSVKAAFAFGITANQILSFLEKHAHYKLLLNTNSGHTSPIPQNVVDQIWLWDRERHRIKWNKVHVHTCLLPGEFNAVKEYALQHGAHAWSSAAKNEVLLKHARAEGVLNFVQTWRANTTQSG